MNKSTKKFVKTYKKPIIIIAILMILGTVLLLDHDAKEKQSGANSQGTIIAGSIETSKEKSEDEWKKILTKEQYSVLRQQGTETPYTGALLNEKRKGTYYSVGCDQPVFRSEAKYESNTGWPSFYEPITPDALVLREDTSYGQVRTEVLDKCGGHLGHVFDDGPQPTGKRFCINSIALRFVPDEKQ